VHRGRAFHHNGRNDGEVEPPDRKPQLSAADKMSEVKRPLNILRSPIFEGDILLQYTARGMANTMA